MGNLKLLTFLSCVILFGLSEARPLFEENDFSPDDIQQYLDWQDFAKNLAKRQPNWTKDDLSRYGLLQPFRHLDPANDEVARHKSNMRNIKKRSLLKVGTKFNNIRQKLD